MAEPWNVIEQRDLGLQIHRSLKLETQVDRLPSLVMALNIMLQLYNLLVRSNLVYCAKFQSPICRKDVISWKRCKKKFTRMSLGLSYEECLNRWDVFSPSL